MDESRREAALFPVLLLTVLVMSVVSSLGAPLIPSISSHLHVSLATAQWSLTVTLLTGAVSATVVGRISDGPRRRPMLIGGLAAVAIGGAVSALAPNLGVLVVGRALQGVGVGLVPVTMAAARDHLPHAKVAGAIAVLSVSSAAGVGAGYPISGLIADAFGVSAAFWFGAAFTAVALVAVVVAFPKSRRPATARLDVLGASLLTVGLVALLVAVAEGGDWGWTSPVVLALLGTAVVVLAAWVRQQLASRAPLVDLRLFRHPAVLSADSCALVLGVAMYMYLSEVTEFVQVPRSTGFGFSASVVVAGLTLVPFSILSLMASRSLPWLARTVGQRGVLPVGSLVVASSGIFFGFWHADLWTAFVMMALLGAGLGLTFAAIPGLIVGAIPAAETGSATGFYQVIRYVGFSLGSALTAAVLAGHTPTGSAQPTEPGYTLVLWIGVGLSVLAAAVAWVLPGLHDRQSGPAAAAPAVAPGAVGSAGSVGPVGPVDPLGPVDPVGPGAAG